MKKVLALLLAVVMVFSMVACAKKDEAPTTPTGDTPTGSDPAENTASGETVGETLKIGVVCPLSGTGATAGKYITNGIKLIEDELKAEGGLLVGDVRYPIEFIYEDNEAKEEITTNVFQKLINQDEVIAIVGPDMSKCILAAGTIAQNAGCAAIGTFTTNTAVTEIGDYLFRACFIDPFQGQVMATYAWEQGYKTAGIIYNNADAYATGLRDSFVEHFTAFGGTIVEEQAYSGSDVKDYNVQLTKIKDAEPEVLIIPNMFTEIPLQVQQARNMGIEIPIVCGDSADSPEVADLAGHENIAGTAFVSAFSAQSTGDAAQKFVKDFNDAYGMDPNSNADLAYEATLMVLEAIRTAETIDRAGVRDALASITDLEVPSGLLSVGEDRNPIKGAAVLMYNEDGTPDYVTTINP